MTGWADIALQNQALLTAALEKLAAADRERDTAIAQVAGLEALGEYLHHWPGCDSIATLPGDCDCGLRGKLRAALAPAAGDAAR